MTAGSMHNMTVRGITWGFVILFVFLVGINYIPFVWAENGRMFGLFKLEPIANQLHVISGIWAAGAALWSTRACLIYFRVFGTAYFIDGIIGVLAGKAYLNLRLFDSHAEPVADLLTRVVINIPHLVIGGFAMYVGFVLYKRLRPSSK